MRLSQKGEPYKLQLRMTAAKAPIWQCDDGRLQMGITDDPGEFTFYFTFTHLLADRVLTLNGKTHKVKGQVWFDRQGGPFTATNVKTNWEWFSLRFFDNEEIMLFSFPQTGYRDGTFIAADGSYRRLNNYEIEPLGFLTEPSTGFRFSTGWKISMPGVKEENYTLTPVVDGMYNVFFYELLADIRNSAGELVGRTFVELLPGARNDSMKPWLAFRRTR